MREQTPFNGLSLLTFGPPLTTSSWLRISGITKNLLTMQGRFSFPKILFQTLKTNTWTYWTSLCLCSQTSHLSWTSTKIMLRMKFTGEIQCLIPSALPGIYCILVSLQGNTVEFCVILMSLPIGKIFKDFRILVGGNRSQPAGSWVVSSKDIGMSSRPTFCLFQLTLSGNTLLQTHHETKPRDGALTWSQIPWVLFCSSASNWVVRGTPSSSPSLTFFAGRIETDLLCSGFGWRYQIRWYHRRTPDGKFASWDL